MKLGLLCLDLMYGHLNDCCTEKYFCSGWMTTDRRADLLNWGFSVIHIFSLHTELHKAFEHTSDLTPLITTLWCFCSESRQTKVRVARFTAAEALRHAQSSIYKQDVCLDYFKKKHASTEMWTNTRATTTSLPLIKVRQSDHILVFS